MYRDIKINGEWLPEPESDPDYGNKKVKTELETEAGTTQVIVIRKQKLTLSASWSVSGAWAEKFRTWAAMDTVSVECYWPNPYNMTAHECQLSVESETHNKNAREQIKRSGGLYKLKVTMTEL